MSDLVQRVDRAIQESLPVDGQISLPGGGRLIIDVETLVSAALAAIREPLLAIVREQPLFPGTYTGMRQQWVKDQIAGKIAAALSDRPPVRMERNIP